jgi:hypothetical protein
MRKILAVAIGFTLLAVACGGSSSKLSWSKDDVNVKVVSCETSTIAGNGKHQRAAVDVENLNNFEVMVRVSIVWSNGDEGESRSWNIPATKGSFKGTNGGYVVADEIPLIADGDQDCSKVIKSVKAFAEPA